MSHAQDNLRGVWLTLGAGVLGAVALAMPVWLLFGPDAPVAPTPDATSASPPVAAPVPPTSVREHEPAPPAPPPVFTPKSPPLQKLIGFTLHGYDREHLTMDDYLRAIDEQAQRGVTALQFVVPIFSGHARSAGVQMLIGEDRSVTPQQIVAILRHAKAIGLHTTLMPQLVLTQPRGSDSRAVIDPPDWDHWWRTYQQVLDQLLGLAMQAEVDAFCIGADLASTERQTHRWVALIAHLRSGFEGYLYYAADAQRYQTPAFWAHLDFIGITGRWNAMDGKSNIEPTVAAHRDDWMALRQEMIDFARLYDRPIILTQVGDAPAPRIADDTPPAPAVTTLAQGYATFFDVWRPLLVPAIPTGSHDPSAESPADWTVGVFLYDWRLPDANRPIVDRPALQDLTRWLSDR